MATQAPNRTNRPPAPARGGLGDLPQRVAIALPALAVAVAAVAVGGAVFAALAVVAGVLAAREAFRLLCAASDRGRVTAGAVTLVWIGVPIALAIALRESDHGGGLVIDVMLAVFVGDTAAHLLGTIFGRRPLAPRISPNKTVEGFAAGLAGGTAAVVAASAFQPWLAAGDAVVFGLTVSVAAVLGDLAESALKRRTGVKDSGRLLGAHGGTLDRLDAVLFGIVAGYVVALPLL